MTTPIFTNDNPNPGYAGNNQFNFQVGEVKFDDDSGKFVEEPNQSYTDYRIHNRYERDNGIYMMGITSPGGFQNKSVAFCQLYSPTLLWICDWTSARWDKEPDVPSPTPYDQNWVLLDVHFEYVNITVAVDGTSALYRSSGTYVYGHTRPAANMLVNMAYPRPPWLQDSFTRTIPQSTLKQGLSDVVGTGGGTGIGGFITGV